MIFLGKEVHNYGEPFFVAEISGNHGGSISNAFQLMEAAQYAGADAVKIQCYDEDDLTIKNGYVIGGGTPWKGQTLHDLYTQAKTPKDWMQPLFNRANELGIPIFSSVYSDAGLEILERVGCPAYKIASYEANDPFFIGRVNKTGKPLVISTGMLSEEELERAWTATGPLESAILLHCVSKYPTELHELGLKTMQQLAYDFDPVGFSCHSDNPASIIAGVACGAAMIEVHLALDADCPQPDFEFSFLPDALKWSINNARQVQRAIKFKTDAVEYSAREFRRSLYIVKDIFKDEIFTEEHIRSCRPSEGCSPHLWPNIIGRKATQTLRAYTPMQMEYVE